MMKLKVFLLAACSLLLLNSCEQSDLLNESQDSLISRSVESSECTFFQNIGRSAEGDYISGDIYCSSDAEYVFTFAFQGDPGTSYEVRIGDTIMRPTGESNTVKHFTMKLKAGITPCSVQAYISGTNRQAYARLVIDKINNSSSEPHDGYGDLTVMYSK